jgi:hypothetical protein
MKQLLDLLPPEIQLANLALAGRVSSRPLTQKGFIIMNNTLLRLPTFRHTGLETCLSCDRSDGKRVEYVLVHPLNISGEGAQGPYLHLSTRKIHKHAANGFNQEIALSMEEARRLRDFLNRPEMAEWLEEEDTEQGE